MANPYSMARYTATHTNLLNNLCSKAACGLNVISDKFPKMHAFNTGKSGSSGKFEEIKETQFRSIGPELPIYSHGRLQNKQE